jgi:hypothetical protein
LQHLGLVDAVAAGADEGTLGVSTERLGTVLCEVVGALGAEGRKDLFMLRWPLVGSD